MKKLIVMLLVLVSGIMNTEVSADVTVLSIYDIQYTENPNGSSYYDTMRVNCTGGIVIHKYQKGTGSQRIILYDPNYADGWGGILAKGIAGASPFQSVNLGDWISLTKVLVCEEAYKARATTTLYFDGSSSFIPKSINNPLPKPLVVSISEIAAPIYDDYNDIWAVIDHKAEIYEDMYLKIIDVTVGEMDLGKANDNYVLYKANDPNIYCWASDYMNIDKPPDPEKYTPVVQTGQHFCSVSGILEQYTKLSDGWDYYQLLTTKQEDFQIDQIADFDDDCDVDFADFSIFAGHWLQNGCAKPDWCGGADLTKDLPSGIVDLSDLLIFVQHWLEGK